MPNQQLRVRTAGISLLNSPTACATLASDKCTHVYTTWRMRVATGTNAQSLTRTINNGRKLFDYCSPETRARAASDGCFESRRAQYSDLLHRVNGTPRAGAKRNACTDNDLRRHERVHTLAKPIFPRAPCTFAQKAPKSTRKTPVRFRV